MVIVKTWYGKCLKYKVYKWITIPIKPNPRVGEKL
jgi:hypothetical protein